MPHELDPLISAMREIDRLSGENAQLRALVSTLCGEIQKIAAELGKLIDKDNH